MSEKIPTFTEVKDQDTVTPQIYFNGFEVNLSLSDFSITLTSRGRTIAHMLLSFTTAKTLSEGLAQAIQTLESTTDREIMTMQDVKLAVNARREREAAGG